MGLTFGVIQVFVEPIRPAQGRKMQENGSDMATILQGQSLYPASVLDTFSPSSISKLTLNKLLQTKKMG